MAHALLHGRRGLVDRLRVGGASGDSSNARELVSPPNEQGRSGRECLRLRARRPPWPWRPWRPRSGETCVIRIAGEGAGIHYAMTVPRWSSA